MSKPVFTGFLVRGRYLVIPFRCYSNPSYDSGAGVEHIEIRSADGSTVAEWRSEDLLVRLAAQDLLDALEQALVALNTAPRFKVPILGVIDSYAVAAICEAAIAKAKGDA